MTQEKNITPANGYFMLVVLIGLFIGAIITASKGLMGLALPLIIASIVSLRGFVLVNWHYKEKRSLLGKSLILQEKNFAARQQLR